MRVFDGFSFHDDGTFEIVLGSKCGTHLEHDCATCGVGSKWLESLVSMRFASWKRYRSDEESDRFEGSCTSKKVPNVLHIWRQKLFQMCSTFGVRTDLR